MRPTMDDIARLAQVSKPTVSRALSGSRLVSEDKRARILEVAREHGYAVNRNAQKLRQVRTNTVAVVLDFHSHRHGAIGDPFIYELLAGVSEALSVRDVDLLLSPAGLESVGDYVDLHRSRGADGFIILGQGMREPILRELARKDIPMAVWGAVMAESGYCAVGSDNFAGGRLAGERFLQLHRKSWVFVGNIAHEEIRLRYAGLAEAARESTEVELDLLRIDMMAFSETMSKAREYLQSGKRPDAVFAFSDTASMAVISAFRQERLIPPHDYSLVGYNNIPPAAHFSPSITTIEQDTSIAGTILVEKLMQQLDGARPKSVTLPTKLIVRET
ncbi:MAG: LacI family DNA-binding transcriptional regulator [Sphingomonadaceae bacterium]|nr:LacI family DNA-binding transcriptional regulator [Sphingomonadaceae bacterium]